MIGLINVEYSHVYCLQTRLKKVSKLGTKALIMDHNAIERAITRLSHEILEKNQGTSDLILVGVRSKGIPFAEKLGERISSIEGKDMQVEYIDISAYRDDVDRDKIEKYKFDFNIEDKIIILIDDVLFTGRTVRAALDAIVNNGRPKKVQLAVLIDRGHREFPIRPDFVGKNVPTSRNERIKVIIEGEDNKVLIEEKFD